MKIFVSYSHEDRRWVKGRIGGELPLIPWLADNLKLHGVEIWSDPGPGGKPAIEYEKGILEEIDRCELAILLISQAFLGSEFIRRVEFPQIRARVDGGRMRLIPILVTPLANWEWSEESRWLTSREILPGKESALIECVEDETTWRRVRVQILGAIRKKVTSPAGDQRKAPVGDKLDPERAEAPAASWRVRFKPRRVLLLASGLVAASALLIFILRISGVGGTSRPSSSENSEASGTPKASSPASIAPPATLAPSAGLPGGVDSPSSPGVSPATSPGSAQSLAASAGTPPASSVSSASAPAMAATDRPSMPIASAGSPASTANPTPASSRDARQVAEVTGTQQPAPPASSPARGSETPSATAADAAVSPAPAEAVTPTLSTDARPRGRAAPGPTPAPEATAAPVDEKVIYRETALGLALEMVWIAGGSFLMGSPDGEPGRLPNEKLHPVDLDGFWICKFETTREQWERVMGRSPSRFKGSSRLPVESVSWRDAMDFCRSLSEKTGRDYTLPTEAQWEYACRAGASSPYGHGDSVSALGEYAWLASNAGGKTHEVGQLKPNVWGLHDLHGNVWEWCRDWYGEYGEASRNPNGPASGDTRVLRGGSWYFEAPFVRSAYRLRLGPALRDDGVGFRVARIP